MEHTMAWKPALDRRQSWDPQEWKHDVQTRQCDAWTGARARAGAGGFSEAG
jgi:hypothetical protein